MEINKFNFTQCIEVDLNKKLMGGMPCILSTQNCKGHLCSEISQTFCFFLRLAFKSSFYQEWAIVALFRTINLQQSPEQTQPLNKRSPWNIWQNNKHSPLNKRSPLLKSRQFESFIHTQMKRKLKSLKKFFKNQKSIDVAPFNKDVAPRKNLKN